MVRPGLTKRPQALYPDAEEAKERDHRKLGKELESLHDFPRSGQGLPFWLPNGATIRRELERYIVDKELVFAASMSIRRRWPLWNSTKLLATGSTIQKTCSLSWTWETGRICPSSYELPAPHPGLQAPCAFLP